MKTDTLLKNEGMEILSKYLGMVEAKRFIMLIQREPFDYTKWRENLFEDMTIEELSKKADEYTKIVCKKMRTTLSNRPMCVLPPFGRLILRNNPGLASLHSHANKNSRHALWLPAAEDTLRESRNRQEQNENLTKAVPDFTGGIGIIKTYNLLGKIRWGNPLMFTA